MNAFWQQKSLDEMSKDEWESLCDGCAKCCLHKLQDDETSEVYYTKVVCRYLDQKTCKCTQYQERNRLVPNCLWLTPAQAVDFEWLPSTCAYRLLAEGGELPSWHPLVSGDSQSVHDKNISVKGRVLSEEFVHPDGLEEHIIHWVE